MCRRGPEASPEDKPTQAVSPPQHQPSPPGAWRTLSVIWRMYLAPLNVIFITHQLFTSIHFSGPSVQRMRGHCKTPLVQLLAAGVKCGLKSRAGKTNFYEV